MHRGGGGNRVAPAEDRRKLLQGNDLPRHWHLMFFANLLLPERTVIGNEGQVAPFNRLDDEHVGIDPF